MITALSLSPAVDKIYFVDGFKPGGLYRVRDVLKSAGGKGINVARVASMLGEKVQVAGFKAGETGRWIETQIINLGIETFLIEVEGESRTNNNIIDRESNMETELLEIGPVIDKKASDALMEGLKKLFSKTSVLVCSGGLPAGVENDFYKKVIEASKPFGIKTILDSSKEVLREGIKACPFIIKPNLRELSELAGRELSSMNDILSFCRQLVDNGVSYVAASLGKEGAVLVSREGCFHAVAPPVEAVNTIGCGDSMVAGIAAGLLRNMRVDEAFSLGMACAASNASFREIGVIDTNIVEEYFKEIKIRKYK